MDFEWTVPKIFMDIPGRGYINDYCIECDDILNQVKSDIVSAMEIGEIPIEIYQEDWGWALEFSTNDVFYFLGLNNAAEYENGTLFTVIIEAYRKAKFLIFTRKIEATNELKEFAEIVSNIAQKNGFEVD